MLTLPVVHQSEKKRQREEGKPAAAPATTPAKPAAPAKPAGTPAAPKQTNATPAKPNTPAAPKPANTPKPAAGMGCHTLHSAPRFPCCIIQVIEFT